MSDLGIYEGLKQLASSYSVARCIHVLADLGVADHLDESPVNADCLAMATGADADALERALRLVAAHGVFDYQDGVIRHSPMSRLLRSDHPQSLRAFARMLGLPFFWDIHNHLDHSIKTGQAGAPLVASEGVWGWLAQHQESSQVFNEAMTAKASTQIDGVIDSYDFCDFKRIADIGGGRGHLLQAILDVAPQTQGILFDRPDVVLETVQPASARFELMGGDFFVDELPSCDAYLLMEVIHDWGDEQALAILLAIRAAAPPHAKLLLIEELIADGAGPHWTKNLDIAVLILWAGRQRTRQQYESLLHAAGFRIARQIDVPYSVSILEAVIDPEINIEQIGSFRGTVYRGAGETDSSMPGPVVE